MVQYHGEMRGEVRHLEAKHKTEYVDSVSGMNIVKRLKIWRRELKMEDEELRMRD